MGEVGDDAPTGMPPTELAAAIDETEAHTAWSLDDGADWEPPRRLTPGRITALALAGSLVVVAAAGAIAFVYLRDRDEPAPPDVTAPTSTVIATPTLTSMTQAPPPPSQPPTPVMLPARGGQVFVGTKSGKTACEITAGNVTCLVKFAVDTPMRYGTPANGVTVTVRGDFDWTIGDTGQQEYPPLDYGVVYRALGWTITPTSEGTTFMNDATGHGMTVSVEGCMPF